MEIDATLKRIRRKSFQLGLKKIPFNLRYKPRRYYPHVSDYLSQRELADFRVIYPAYTSTLALPDNFYRAITVKTKPPPEVNKPKSFVLKIDRGRIYADPYMTNIAIIDGFNQAVGDISFQYIDHHVVNDVGANDIFKTNFFKPPRRLKGSAFVMASGGGGIANYFHWMFDNLPKLHLLEKSGFKADKIIVPSFKKPFQKETLKALGIGEELVVDFSDYKHLSADCLIVSNSAGDVSERSIHENIHYPRWAVDFLRHKFTRRSSEKGEKSIFISRRSAGKRKIVNEEAVYPVLAKYDIDVYDPAVMSFPDQVDLFESAKLVVAPHGAALSNLAFCKPGTKVLEIFSDRYVKGLYAFIAGIAGLDYDYLLSQGSNVQQKPNFTDILIDIDEFDRKLSEAMNEVSQASVFAQGISAPRSSPAS